uniref:Uncharacterized protein n=1 Tax=Chenopodium quinoa TaxID=63459 RepID=A0A803MVR2_CHEQI
MSSHGVERCYKLHGYPLGWNGNRAANMAIGDSGYDEGDGYGNQNAEVQETQNVQSAQGSMEQYQQFVAWLGKHKDIATNQPDIKKSIRVSKTPAHLSIYDLTTKRRAAQLSLTGAIWFTMTLFLQLIKL